MWRTPSEQECVRARRGIERILWMNNFTELLSQDHQLAKLPLEKPEFTRPSVLASSVSVMSLFQPESSLSSIVQLATVNTVVWLWLLLILFGAWSKGDECIHSRAQNLLRSK